jgi:VWFA-related protein
MTRRLVALSLLCLSASWTSAQTATESEQATPGPTFRTGVELVMVDVTVLGSDGRPVTDLRAPEFGVEIDGRPRRVVTAEYVAIDVARDRKAVAFPVETHYTSNIGPPAGRLIVLAVDQGNIALGAARPILTTAGKFLDDLSPEDRVAFVTLPPPGPIVDFTTDHQAVRDAMERVTGSARKFEGKYNLGMAEALSILGGRDHQKMQEIVMRECGQIYMNREFLERCEREIEMQAGEAVLLQKERTQRTLGALSGLLRQLSEIDGQKSLIFVSEGLQLEGMGGEVDQLAELAGLARVTINVLLMDVPRFDVTQAFFSPTADQDRQMQRAGLELLAGQARGAIFEVTGTGEGIFDRLATEMSGYYLLGVEQEASDRDGRRHRIDVQVRRRGVSLRSRRAFVLPERPDTLRNAEEALANALRSPFAVSELPVRATTYAYQDRAQPGKVRIVVAAEIGQGGAPAEEFMLGFAIVDAENNVAASASDRVPLAPTDEGPDAPLVYSTVVELDPGSYTLRFGAVDGQGRRGTVLRPLQAWQMEGQEFAVGDLVLSNVSPEAEGQILPGVEARIRDGRLAAYLELYSSVASALEQTSIRIELAENEASPPLVTVAARTANGARPERHVAQAIIPTDMLPPGRYVARAQIEYGGKPAGLLTRPFVVLPRGERETLPQVAPMTAMMAPPPAFEAAAAIAPGLLGSILDLVERGLPALTSAVAEARGGQYGAAARAAFEAGEQAAASFLRGLELFTKGQLDQAATHLNAAAGPRRDFFPAAFYLGACFAAAGRDRDAAAIWQMAVAAAPPVPAAYVMLADARFRDGHPEAAVPALQAAHTRWPDDDAIGRRLALAYTMTGEHAKALEVLHGYLSRNPADQDALFAAVMAFYETSAGRPLSASDHAQLTRYATAYRGPRKALVSKYVEAMQP